MISESFIKLHGQIHHQLKLVRRRGRGKDLHAFRIACKELDAFRQWCSCFMSPGDAALLDRWFYRIRPLYKRIGKLRAAKLMLKMGSELGFSEKMPETEISLLKTVESAQEHLKAFLKWFRLLPVKKLTKIFQQYDSLPDSLLLAERNKLVQRHHDEALEALCSEPGDHWHDARRLLRLNHFLMQLPAKDLPVVEPGLSEKWAVLAEDLGNWHDRLELLRYLQKQGVQRASVIDALNMQIADYEEIINACLSGLM